MLEIGIVGLPNVGKSTLFNVLTSKEIPAENYPFCTIDKNEAVVEFKDSVLEHLAKTVQSNKLLFPLFKFVDIAGLVRGASKGEGLGNMFLSHIREVDLILYTLRAFKDKNITHVEGGVNPLRDLQIVFNELLLKDIESVEKKIEQLKKHTHRYKPDQLKVYLNILVALKQHLEQEKSAYLFLHSVLSDKVNSVTPLMLADRSKVLHIIPELEIVYDLFLLTAKPALFVLNVSYLDLGEDDEKQVINQYKKQLIEYAANHIVPEPRVTLIDARSLYELYKLDSQDRQEFIKEFPVFFTEQDLLKKIINYLGLIRIFVGSSKDVREMLVPKGTTVWQAAGLIHSDLQKNFVRAKIANIQDVIKNNIDGATYTTVGKEYILKDGDYFIVLAS